ncbi:urea transporter [bacterium]|nr:urea transporter [bacterium]
MNHLSRVFRWYGTIFFSSNPIVGILIFLSVTGSEDYGFSALLCGHLTYGYGKWFEFPEAEVDNGLYGCNGVLFGLFLGSHFADPTLLFILSAGGSFLVCLLTRTFSNTLGWYLKIPTCSYPFVFATLLISHLSHSQELFFGIDIQRHFSYSSGYIESFLQKPFHLYFTEKLLREVLIFTASIGAILFQKKFFFCFLALTALVLSSRVTFLLALIGFFWMRSLLFFLPFSCEGNETFLGFNAILISISLGGAFFVPGRRTLLLMLLSQMGAMLIGFSLISITKGNGGEFTALPFNFIVSGAIIMLQGRAFNAKPFQPALYFSTPEEAINYYRRYQERIFLRAIPLPVFGEWKIVQGFDGEETHKAHWRYGVDLAAVDEEQSRFRSTGIHADDYFTFNAPVRSPVYGVVSVVWDQVTDNSVGETNLREPWGNFVLIFSAGVYIGLYHLKKGSIVVAPGQIVSIGTPIGKVGNSGRSAQPHLHLQIQLYPNAGAPNIPFMFQDVILKADAEKTFYPFFKPAENANLSDIAPNDSTRTAFSPKAGEEWRIEIEEKSRKKSACWKFQYSLYGNIVVTSDQNEEVEFRLSSRSIEIVRFSSQPLSPLNLFAISIADLPYENFPGLRWESTLYGKPAYPFLPFWKKIFSWLGGEIFSVTCYKRNFQDENDDLCDSGLVSVQTRFVKQFSKSNLSLPWLQASFNAEGFKELIMYENDKVVAVCRRIFPQGGFHEVSN